MVIFLSLILGYNTVKQSKDGWRGTDDRRVAKATGRKVRTPQGRVLHNVESRQREGKCNRE